MKDLNQPRDGYSQVKSWMRRFGPLLIAIGALMAVIGVGQFFMSFVSGMTSDSFAEQSAPPVLVVILGMPGLLILGLGIWLTQAGYLKEITQYGAKETVPAVTTSVTAIRAAITDDDIPCPVCSLPIEPGSKFCSSCGVQIGGLTCPKCNTSIEPNDRFCNECGAELSARTATI